MAELLQLSPSEDAAMEATDACLACGASGVEEFLDLGRTPLANRFLTAEPSRLPQP